jgi:hypothetical protein
MSGYRDTWRARGPFGVVEIELHPGSVSDAAREASRRELGRLVYDFKYRDREARRVVLEVYARMRGLPGTATRGAAYEFDRHVADDRRRRPGGGHGRQEREGRHAR